MAKRRNRFEIILDILNLIQRKGGKVKPTHILYGGNLSYNRLKGYIEELEKKDMIKEIEFKGKKFYELTEKGISFINETKRIKEITDAFGL